MNDIEKIKLANQQAGQFFFSPDTMRFFRSRLSNEVERLPNGGALFITSEQNHGMGGPYPRLFTIRMAKPDGDVDTVGEFQAFNSRASAIRVMRKLAEWCRS